MKSIEKTTRVLITAPLKQDAETFGFFQDALDALEIPDGVSVDRFFVVNDCAELIPFIRGEYVEINTGDVYTKTHNDHIWRQDNLTKMEQLRNATIEKALNGKYDYWWSIDTDVIVKPETLRVLLDADKDIVSEIFWTRSRVGTWWCNGWLYDQADADGHFTDGTWNKPGLYQVGMTGACTLVKTSVFKKGVNYTRVPNLRKVLYGEDRWFSIRAACLGFEMWLDTHCPAEHLFTPELLADYRRRMQNAERRKNSAARDG